MSGRLRGMSWWCVVVLAGLLAACGGSSEGPPAGSSIYEDFSGSVLNGSKWGAPSFERSIVANQLRLSAASTGMVSPRSYFNRLRATAGTVDAIQADVTVSSASVSGTGADARASIEMRFQDPAYSGTSQNFYGVRVELREAGSGLRSTAYLFACADPDCESTYIVAGGTTWTGTFPFAPANIGQTYTLGISRSGTVLTISLNGASSTLDAAVHPYFDPANLAGVALNIQLRQGSGTSGGSASMVATFDNVMLDTGAGPASYDTFSAALIDPTKWIEGEASAAVSGGALQLTQHQADRLGLHNIPIFSAGPVRGLYAEVAVTDVNTVGADVNAYARVGGTFFHEGGLGDFGGGYNGDVWAQVHIDGSDAYWAIVRCTNRNTCTANDVIASGQLNTVGLTLGATYALSVEWDGTLLHFKAGDLPEVTWNPVTDGGLTVLNPHPSNPFLAIGTRTGGTIGVGDSGTISATFDNVNVINRSSTAGAITNVMLDAFEGSIFPLLDQHRWNGCEFGTSVLPGSFPTPSATNELLLELLCGNLQAGQSVTHAAHTRTTGIPTKVQVDINVPSGVVVPPNGGHLRTMVELSYQPAQYQGWSDLYDAGARVELRDTGSGLTARGLIYLCQDDNCSTSVGRITPDTGDFTADQTIAYDTTYTISVEYDTGNSRFILTITDGAGFTRTGTFNTSHLGGNFDSTYESTYLAVRVAAGSTDGYYGWAAGLFDNVQLDTGAGLALHDDFVAANVDTAKWRQGDADRWLNGDGVLTVHQRQGDTQALVNASVDRAGVVGMWADATITALAVTGGDASNDAVPAARLSGYFYKDATAGTGRMGNIGAVIDLRETEVRYGVFRCIDAACSDGQNIANGTLTTGLSINTTARIGLLWTGTVFRFYLDGNAPVELDPATVGAAVAGTAVHQGMSLGTRVQSLDLTPGAAIVGVGEITATFDNVVVAHER